MTLFCNLFIERPSYNSVHTQATDQQLSLGYKQSKNIFKNIQQVFCILHAIIF